MRRKACRVCAATVSTGLPARSRLNRLAHPSLRASAVFGWLCCAGPRGFLGETCALATPHLLTLSPDSSPDYGGLIMNLTVALPAPTPAEQPPIGTPGTRLHLRALLVAGVPALLVDNAGGGLVFNGLTWLPGHALSSHAGGGLLLLGETGSSGSKPPPSANNGGAEGDEDSGQIVVDMTGLAPTSLLLRSPRYV